MELKSGIELLLTGKRMEKTCNTCGTTTGVFGKDKNAPGGISRYCKTCKHATYLRRMATNSEGVKAEWRRNYVKHRDLIIKRAAAWTHKNREKHNARTRELNALNPERARMRSSRYYAAHREIHLARCAAYRKNNKEKANAAVRRWEVAHPEQAKARNQRWRKAHPEHLRRIKWRWNKAHPEAVRAMKRRHYARQMATAQGRLNGRMGSAIWHALKAGKAGWHWETLVGYTIIELQRHLEHLFLSGMTWDNMSEWHIDHIVPKAFFRYDSPTDQEFLYCGSLDNLRPLWGPDNLKKGAKVTLCTDY